ncbi:NADH-ubiquinone oxidoreductase-like protein [Thermochaetoides thermophila DSM 1495]|uniref:NADH dehydrogenase [ubiquinone] iron-sulfur protein 4, mitochondrial n=1 Tax=Chaetomium thermophilum (strain DSM 1495 / CBS 144.50 / IMI 039719) TaxID=759272 RepID=G0S3Y7_CHATD|nr:NADH-ubiquinone oxidoreductase-like protein [Thermochaetoides thermophila DSM 1495]EGS22049.1 NADH-ubiquinone oxidoreductase-like protein [Thermochaetoides thermophila DSM 1495]7ZM7_Y Chain Y, NADH dehydrogenase [ubiquinone] iron-sulfur protein 4, mitochondrial [Thermochaetoides thermophila DSM 1495]7ZMB_Y Chain Y, NADH dehydrogenase [ubiquinone] iron-sulfur protein 4, mitochondrial [Thermochaetoides thermophila DSM 1495]7ZMG_Y Chain Y, NADH dehydrogenase [ubiquinone] iron-sulfur protein 4, 
MSSLRPAATSAARLLRNSTASSRATAVAVMPCRAAHNIHVPVQKERTKEDSPLATLPRNAPDYNVPIDIATSTFTPVPKNVQDGSEENVVPAGLISGAPMELQARTVRIYKPAKPATQSGEKNTQLWRMDWDVLGKGHRWENPLMGWQSSADFMQGTHLTFKTKEDAIAFAEKQGYEYFVQEPNERHFRPKAYANNFLYSPGKLKHIRTK